MDGKGAKGIAALLNLGYRHTTKLRGNAGSLCGVVLKWQSKRSLPI
jgi:hypothetical protein